MTIEIEFDLEDQIRSCHLPETPDPADLIRCIKTLLRDEQLFMVRHNSAVLGRQELNGAMTELMASDPKGYDAVVFTERESSYLRTANPEYPRYKVSEVARMKSVTRRTILRYKARALQTLVALILRAQGNLVH